MRENLDGSVRTRLVYTYRFVFPLERYFMVCLELLDLLVCPVQVCLQLCVLESGKAEVKCYLSSPATLICEKVLGSQYSDTTLPEPGV